MSKQLNALNVVGNIVVKGTANLEGALTVGTSGTDYMFPTARGTTDQILQTNGSGAVTWEDAISAVSTSEAYIPLVFTPSCSPM